MVQSVAVSDILAREVGKAHAKSDVALRRNGQGVGPKRRYRLTIHPDHVAVLDVNVKGVRIAVKVV